MATKSLREPLRSREVPATKLVASPREMSRADICNVEPVSAGELEAALGGLVDGETVDRWSLTLEGMTCAND